MADTEAIKSPPVVADAPQSEPIDYVGLAQKIATHPMFLPIVFSMVGLAAIYWPLWGALWRLWIADDGYYSHGFIVPLLAGYVIFRWWDWLHKIPAKVNWIALVPLVFGLYASRIASANLIEPLMSALLLFSILCCIWFVAGWKWMLALMGPVLYLATALPLFSTIINDYTNPLQQASTAVSFQLLKLTGFQAWQFDPTIIYMNNFTLNVDVPCSGLKLVLALIAFATFFVFIARLNWKANVVMIAMILPLALFINGLRIALIGMVGETQGHAAGMQFHDYSGYITLLVCFYIFFKIARLLGWKD
jgi:exosortase